MPTPSFANLTVLDHPLIQHKLSILRDRETSTRDFKQLVSEIATLMAYEATKDLATEVVEIHTPLERMIGRQVSGKKLTLVPILRAGLGMVDPILSLIPTAEVWHLGLYRDEETARPVEYYSKLPKTSPVDVALVVDPMLATGGSITAALETLTQWGVPHLKVLSVIASQFGVDTVASRFPQAQIYVCAIDPELNDRKFIVPGLGDAGDRIFNTLR